LYGHTSEIGLNPGQMGEEKETLGKAAQQAWRRATVYTLDYFCKECR